MNNAFYTFRRPAGVFAAARSLATLHAAAQADPTPECKVGTEPRSPECGVDSSATSDGATAIGDHSVASGPVSTAVGERSRATELFSTALGALTFASGMGSSAVGAGAVVTAEDATAVGSRGTGAALSRRNREIAQANEA